jgi:tetratricopeptide (TPR) repeat protein
MAPPLSDYVAFGAHKLPPTRIADRDERIRSYEHMLCRALNLRTVVAFVGAGCSAAFGYPNWEEFARKTVELTRRNVPPKHRARLNEYLKVLKSYGKGRCPADKLTLFVEICKSILIEEEKLDAYNRKVRKLFKLRLEAKDVPDERNPYLELFNLKIHRFVTTNYDLELERNLIQARHLESADAALKHLCGSGRGRPKGTLRSFSQDRRNYEDLALFALAKVRGHEDAVFHCHGRFDEPDSLIASESDYQSWYLGDKDDSRLTFRQTMELLLESNPLLFVGYGLHDDDLLRPLRHLNALDPKRKPGRPFFALVGCTPDDKIDDEVLYERYGVHVIPYQVAPGADRVAFSAALCAKLRDLGGRWEEDRREWTKKPKVRRSLLSKLDEALYIDNLMPTEVPVGQIAAPDGQTADLDAAMRKPGLLCIRGPGGSGKSLHLLRAMQSCVGFERRFYWNAHYGGEFLPAFDDALAFFRAGGNGQESRHESMRRILRERKLLWIIDGCERFLHKTGFSGRVESYSSAFSLLLKQLNDPDMRSTVILAGRLLPSELASAAAKGRPPRLLRVYRVVTADLARLPAASTWVRDSYPDTSLTALCSLLRGHNYGIRLADHYLTLEADATRRPERLRSLLEMLSIRPPDQRLAEMVRVFIAALDEDRAGLVQALLERMARFLGPVCDAACAVCYRAAIKEVKSESSEEGLGEVLDLLLAKELIFRARRNGTGKAGYCVHATARAMLLQPRHGLAADALPDFGISSLTSGRIDVDPDPERRLPIEKLCSEVMEEAEARVVQPDGRPEAGDLCVDAFALLRGTMAANTAPRWGNYDAYSVFGIRLARLVKAVCATELPECSWSYCEYFDRHLIESDDGPLHVAELAWLYNDVGLALSAEGLLADAYSIWEQAFEISRTMEHFLPGGGYRIEVLLNLTHVFIEMGRLREALRYLEQAERFNAKLGDADFGGRILGFRGLLAHLGGNLPDADELYGQCAQRLRDGNNLRAQSVFHKHHADLRMSMEDLDQAQLLIRKSRALAEAGNFPDLVAFARVSQGHLLARRKHYKDSRQEYQSLLQEAQRMGARKLEAECQSTLSSLSLQEGDIEGARVRAMKALGLANELALGLRLTHSMVVLGLATITGGQRQLGVAYLRNARLLASEQEYWLCRWRAQTALQELGEV